MMVQLTLSNKECSHGESCWVFISCVTVYKLHDAFLIFTDLHELAQIPNFAERAQCIIFRSVFSEGITALQSKVEIITRRLKAFLLPNSRITLPFLGVEEGAESGKDHLESFVENFLP